MLCGKGLEVVLVSAPRNIHSQGGEWANSRHLLADQGVRLIVADRADSQEILDLINDVTMGFSHGAPWIFGAPLIDYFGGRLLNYHPTRLPLMRGGGSHSWRIMMGDARGAFTIHLIDNGLDTGEIVRTHEFEYPKDLRLPEDFMHWEQETGLGFLSEFFDDVIAQKSFSPKVQDSRRGTYFPRLNTGIHAAVDWSWKAEQIERFICAFDKPYIGAFTYIGNRRVRLKDCRVAELGIEFHPFQCGLIVRLDSGSPYVVCRDGLLLIGEVLDEHSFEHIALALGDRLHTPREDLDKAMATRVKYTPRGMKALS